MIVETQQQAGKWEDAAAAQLKLDDLRQGKLPALAGEEEAEEERAGAAHGADGRGNAAAMVRRRRRRRRQPAPLCLCCCHRGERLG